MEPVSTPEVLVQKTSGNASPWGVFISLLLILVIIVGGAYYTFSKRYAPLHHAPVNAAH